MLSDLYMYYATGRLDESDALDEQYINAIVLSSFVFVSFVNFL